MTHVKYDLTEPPGSNPAEGRLPTSPAGLPGASNAQLKFLSSLACEREMPEDARRILLDRIDLQLSYNDTEGDCAPPRDREGLTKSRASDFITRLKDRPRSGRSGGSSYRPPSPEQVPAGHYALKNAEGQLRFFHVWRPKEDPASRVNLYLEHGDSDSQIRFASGEFIGILKAIAEDSLAAARLYGLHTKSCSECGRRLTNRVSRLLCIGPVCGGHHCDEEIWTRMKEKARDALRAAGLDPSADVEDTDDLDRIRELAGL